MITTSAISLVEDTTSLRIVWVKMNTKSACLSKKQAD